MKRVDHPLEPSSPGTRRVVTSLHYGERADRSEKVYLQASLHADEVPGMLVLHHLVPRLADAEARGILRGEVVVVPVANPIGLAQRWFHGPIGRFETATGENFNRGYPDFLAALVPQIRDRLGDDPLSNRDVVRDALRAHVASLAPATELEALRKALSALACDADVVLDLHCDHEAVLHLYCEEPNWPQCVPLAQALGAGTVLLAKDSGGASFDEAIGGVWWKLDEWLARETGDAAGARPSIPMACLGVTIELRGQVDVDHATAARDADALFDYLVVRGLIDAPMPALPALRCEPTPLAGAEELAAPHAGVIAFARDVGDDIASGDLVAEIVDPLERRTTEVRARRAGRLYTRSHRRYAVPGMVVARIAGAVAFRTGKLLSP